MEDRETPGWSPDTVDESFDRAEIPPEEPVALPTIDDPGWSPPPPPPPRRSKRRRTVIAVLAGLVAFALGISTALLFDREEAPRSEPLSAAALDQNDAPQAHSSLSGVIEDVLPSVVNVRTTSIGFDPLGGTQEGQSEGSGVVIDKDGIIVTNNHVIAGAVKVTVVFNDDEHKQLEGEVVGADPEHDLAVVKVEADDLDPVPLGNSSDLKLGDDVIALGFPLGLGGPTVTKGIVSGLDRTIDVQGGPSGVEHLEGVLQTDAAINPGNSGGALVDAEGRLIGINSAAANAGSAENVGFAIAIDESIPILNRIISEPRERQAWLGVQVDSIGSDAEAFRAGVPVDTRGALVVGVIPDSPADDAGFREGDVITSISGKEIESPPDLTSVLADHDPGEKVDVSVVNGETGERTISVELAQRPAAFSEPQG